MRERICVCVCGFPSPITVALPRLKNPICPTIYPLLDGEKKQIDSCLFPARSKTQTAFSRA